MLGGGEALPSMHSNMEKKAVTAVFSIRLIFSLAQIASKVSFDGGVSVFVFTFYRQTIATALLSSVALVFERKNFPKLSFVDYVKYFALAFFGTAVAENCLFVGLSYTSATISSAALNSVPVITFVLAVLLGQESIKGDCSRMVFKVMGIMLCMGGVVTMALYKGPHVQPINHHPLLRLHGTNNNKDVIDRPNRNWVLGSFLILLSCLSWSLVIVLQRNFFKKCPSMLIFTALIGFFGSIQTFAVALIFERDLSKFKSGLALIDLSVYCMLGLASFIQSWLIKKVGPVVYAMSGPLTLLITILICSIVLGDATPLGSVVGGALMIGGLYSVVYAKRNRGGEEGLQTKEQESVGREMSSATANEAT